MRKKVGVAPGFQGVLDTAVADGWHGLYDPTNPDHRTIVSDEISQLSDSLGNLTALNAASSTRRPAWIEAGLGSMDVMRWSSSEKLISTAFASGITIPFFVICVGKVNATTNSFRRLFNSHNSINVYLAASTSGDNYNQYAGTTLQGFSGGGSDLNPHVFGLLYNDINSELWVDSQLDATGDAGSNSLAGLTLGSIYNDGQYWQGDIGLWAIYDGNPSAAVRDRMFDAVHNATEIPKAV